VSVKSSQSGARMLTVLEAIAGSQPIGASALARDLGEDKSAVQRSIVTLSKAGWIAPTVDRPVRWELSARLFSLAHLPHSADDLRERCGPALNALRDETGETAFLAIPDLSHFIVVEVAESRLVLRTAPRIGEYIAADKSATGKAMLPFFGVVQQAKFLGRDPTAQEIEQFEKSAQQRFAISVDEVLVGSTNIAAPIFDSTGRPQAAIAISGPSSRLTTDNLDNIGRLLANAASRLSRRQPVAAA